MPGFPIRTSPDQRSVGSSPRLIAASHVLHRLLAPRHPPCALCNLATLKDARARYVVLKVPDPGPARPPARTRRVVWRGGLGLLVARRFRPGGRRRRRGRGPVCWTLPQSSTVCAAEPTGAPPFRRPRRAVEVLGGVGRSDRVASDRHPRSSRACETVRLPGGLRGGDRGVLLRKEVIQPHLPVRLPCYDFVPIADPTFDSSLPCGLGHWLRVLPTFVT